MKHLSHTVASSSIYVLKKSSDAVTEDLLKGDLPVKLIELMESNYRFEDYPYINDRLNYIDYIDKNYTYPITTVSPMDAYRYQGNLFGLFKLMGVDPSMFVMAMHLNNITNPANYDGKRISFKIPSRVPIPEY